MCVTHNGEMPHQLLWWVHHELAVMAIRGPIENRSGGSSLDQYKGAWVTTYERSSSSGLIASESGL